MPSTGTSVSDVGMSSSLGVRERALLDLEARWPRHSGAKEEDIRATLGLTPARYYQLLGRLIDTGAAVEYDPMLITRLRRIRDTRAQTTERGLSGSPRWCR
jgi:hypothetical protein